MKRLLAVFVLIVAASGCSIRREVSNAHLRELDSSWIEPGVTTRREVLRHFGFPPLGREGSGGRRSGRGPEALGAVVGVSGGEGVMVDGIGVDADLGGGPGRDTMQWTVSDALSIELVAGYIVTPTFSRDRQHPAEQLLVRFNADDIVTLVSRTRSKDGKSVELMEWKELGK